MNFLKHFMTTINRKIVTHNGSFHSDDIFACATLSILFDKRGETFELARTRDEEIIKNADYVFDVGGIYDPATNRFDHHQIGGAGKRDSSIEYSSFGLVWKHFGVEITESEEIFRMIDKRLAAPIDAHDNGMDLVEKKYDVSPYIIQDLFISMRPTWRESYVDVDQKFLECVAIAKKILLREIVCAKDFIIAEESVITIYKNTEDKRIIVLDKDYPYGEALSNFPEPCFVVYPKESDNTWGARTVRVDNKSFKSKKYFPTNWAGLRDEEFAKISGVEDAVFCHRALFLAVAKSREGAIKLAQIALVS